MCLLSLIQSLCMLGQTTEVYKAELNREIKDKSNVRLAKPLDRSAINKGVF